MRIKNWKLALLALLFICLFTSLGIWQVSRAHQKQILLKSFAERTQHSPFTANDLTKSGDLRFYRVKLQGTFDNNHTLLLDNKIFHGQVGYEVYTPFKANGMRMRVLVDRGFVPMRANRNELPPIAAISGPVSIVGMVNVTPTYVAFGQMNESSQLAWPLRIEFINQEDLAKLLNYSLFPYIIQLTPETPGSYAIEWQIVTMGPERHMGYAVQWFALALTLLILFVALNRDRAKG